MKSILWAGMALAMSISLANAADAVSTAPAGFVWTGGYVGLQAGYAWGEAPYYNEDDESTDYDPKGAFGGIYAGYNHQLPNDIVLGIDGDINFSGIDSRVGYLFGSTQADDHVATSEIKYTAALRARLGYAVDRWLPYVAGGLSVAKFAFDLDHDGTGDFHFQEEKAFTGWNLGLGLEYAATDNLLVRAEYRYSDFGDWAHSNDWAEDAHIKLRTHDVRLGIAYKF